MIAFKRLITSLIEFLWPNVWIMDGFESSSGQVLKLLYSGDGMQKNYIASLVYEADCQEMALGRIFLIRLYFITAFNLKRCSLSIIEGYDLNRLFFKSKKDFFVPLWLRGEADTPLKARNKSAKDDLRKIRKHKLNFIIGDSEEHYKLFYSEMYLPTVIGRHQKSAIVMDWDHMMREANKGQCQLILVEKSKDYIAGMVCVTSETPPRLWSVGVRENDRYLSRLGALAASYYFATVFLNENGHDKVHMGLTRSFLSDGVLNFKKKWGTVFSSHGRRGFIIKPLNPSAGLMAFLCRNPFVQKEKDKLVETMFLLKDQPLSDKECQAIIKKYKLQGTSGLKILRFTDDDDLIYKEIYSVSHQTMS
jgi:hypothetical protein